MGEDAESRTLHAEEGRQANRSALPIPRAEARLEASRFVELLETAASTGSGMLQDPAAPDEALAFLNTSPPNEDVESAGGVPEPGRVLWEQVVLDLRIGDG